MSCGEYPRRRDTGVSDEKRRPDELFFAQFQTLNSFLHEGRIDKGLGIAVFYSLRVKTLVKAGDHSFNAGLPRQRHAADGVVLFHIGIVSALEQRRIFLPA